MSKTYTTAQIVAESLRRSMGEPTIPDEDFEEAVNKWAESLPPRIEPYTLKDLHEAMKRLRSGLFAVEPHLNKPFKEDPRWTPYSRFVEPRISEVSHIVEQLIIQENRNA